MAPRSLQHQQTQSTGRSASNEPPQRQRTHVAARAACEACRRVKMRCIRPPTQGSNSNNLTEPCERCKRSNQPCTIRERKPQGRKPGAVGRYHGIEKVYRKMQSELRKARASLDGAHRVQEIASKAEAEGETEILQMLCSDEPEVLDTTFVGGNSNNKSSADDTHFNASYSLSSNLAEQMLSPRPPSPVNQNREPINNPLALLADASGAAQALHQQTVSTTASPLSHVESTRSYQSPSSRHGVARQLLSRPGYVSLGLQLSRASLEQGLEALFTAPSPSENRHLDYFKPLATGPPRDVGPDVDPVDLGLVTMEEAYRLFPIYFSRLHPVNGILDPILHTPEYVKARSALLFTWILALTTQFEPSCGSLAKRLRLHGDKLSRHVHTCGFKSVEIVKGYYISLLSATPAKTIAEERLWLYTNYAFSIAAELGLDQRARTHDPGNATSHVHTRPGSPTPSGPFHRPVSDDFLLQDPTYLTGEREARNRERTWLRILLWERANSAACGRVTTFPETELTRNIETWWLHPLADSTDKYTCAFILLRRELAALHIDLRMRTTLPHPSSPRWIVEMVDAALQSWTEKWISHTHSTSSAIAASSTATAETAFSDVYLYHVYIHGRLWTLCYALYYASKNRDATQDLNAIREDCFEAAVKVCEIAVRDLQTIGEPLYCMLAPTWAMISYAAVLALQLFPLLYGTRPGYEVELLSLLGQLALQLQRAGSTPSHRFGIAALLGQHLLVILRTRAANLTDSSPRATDNDTIMPVSQSQEHYSGSIDRTDISPYDQFLTAFDPFFASAPTSADMECNGEPFSEMFRELFGQGFGGAF